MRRLIIASGQAAGLILGVVLVTIGTLFALSLAAGSLDRSVYRERISAAIESGTFSSPAVTPFAAQRSYRYHFNDCLIGTMLVLDRKGTYYQDAVSPSVPVRQLPGSNSNLPDHPMCRNLSFALAVPSLESDHYHRYIHGDWVLASVLLCLLPFEAATALLFLTLLALPLATMAIAARRLKKGSDRFSRDAAYLAMSVCFLLFSGIWLYGWSFSFAPSDIVLFGFFAFAYCFPLTMLRHWALVIATAALGSLTAAFEFLNGATPAAAAVIVASIAFNPRLELRDTLSRLAIAMTAFAAAYLLAFLCKIGAVAALWGWDEVAEAGAQLAWRAGPAGGAVSPAFAAQLARVGVDAQWLDQGHFGGFVYSLIRLVYHSDMFVLGSRTLGILCTVVAPAALITLSAISCWAARGAARVRGALLLGSGAVILAWYVIFANHTIGHATFMMRPLSWLTVFFFGVIAWTAADRVLARAATA